MAVVSVPAAPAQASQWPDGACPLGRLSLTLTLDPSIIQVSAGFRASWTLRNLSASTCDVFPCATNLSLLSDDGIHGGGLTIDCTGPTGFTRIDPAATLTGSADDRAPLAPGSYTATLMWSSWRATARLTVRP